MLPTLAIDDNFISALHPNVAYVGRVSFASGTMIRKGSEREQKLNATLDRVIQAAHAEGAPHVYRFDMTPEDGSCGWGSCFHPSKARHAKMAEELTAYLRTIIDVEAK